MGPNKENYIIIVLIRGIFEMSVGLEHPQKLVKISGIRLSASSAEICNKKRNDIALIEISPSSVTSAAFTKNYFCAALKFLTSQTGKN